MLETVGRLPSFGSWRRQIPRLEVEASTTVKCVLEDNGPAVSCVIGAAFGRFSSRLRAVWISLTAYRIKTQQAAGIWENTDGFALSPQNVPL